MSTSNIMFDVSKYSFNEIKPLLSEIHESLEYEYRFKNKIRTKNRF